MVGPCASQVKGFGGVACLLVLVKITTFFFFYAFVLVEG